MRLTAEANNIAVLFYMLMAILISLSHRSRLVFQEQRWLAGCGYDGCVVRVESQIDVAGRRGHIVNIQTTENGINYSIRSHASLHETTCGCGCFE